jgi:hypothetical protein
MVTGIFWFGFIYFIITWLMPFILPQSFMMEVLAEDNIVENMTAFYLLLTSILWILAFFYSKKGNHFMGFTTKRNYIYLLLGALFFFGAGEEISWGQRVLAFDTPEILQTNEQEEANLHNMPFFNAIDTSNPFQMHRLFLYFWATFTILIPLAAMSSPRVKIGLKRLGFPIVPLSIGGLFLISYLASKVYTYTGIVNHYTYGVRLLEIRESQQALFFMCIALYIAYKHVNKPQEITEVVPNEI